MRSIRVVNKLPWRSEVNLDPNLMSVPARAEIAHDVLSYLIENAEAGDTLEGIVEWWLLERSIRRSVVQVKETLDELVAIQLIREHTGGDKRVHYRINASKENEIRALIEQTDR